MDEERDVDLNDIERMMVEAYSEKSASEIEQILADDASSGPFAIRMYGLLLVCSYVVLAALFLTGQTEGRSLNLILWLAVVALVSTAALTCISFWRPRLRTILRTALKNAKSRVPPTAPPQG